MEQNRCDLIRTWKEEEEIAYIHGWDFSYLDGRYEQIGDLSWEYGAEIRRCLTPQMRLLDIDTGGGEFLLSLDHPYENTAATENYPPNVTLCQETLLPLGIDFKQASGHGPLPYGDKSFDMVIDRHGDFCASEIYRVLKPGGLFITQQVGAENDRELVELLLSDQVPIPFPDQYLSIAEERFCQAGFDVVKSQEEFRPLRFYDVGALVWFARILPWEFPGFCVEDSLTQLMLAQDQLEKQGYVEGRIHRFLLVVKKPESEN